MRTDRLVRAAWGMALAACAACQAPAAPDPAPVARPVTEDRFEIRNLEGWTVYANRTLKEQHAGELARTMEHLRWELYQIRLAVPPEAVRNMQENNAIWIEYKEKVSLSYHPSRSWLVDRGYQVPRDPESMMSLSVATHIHDSYRHPFVVFHELAHGYDYHFIGKGRDYGDARCQSNYERMMKEGRYEKVRIWDGRTGSHYARTSRMEYWAESSEAYFAVNDIYPFVRAELRRHDPDMAAFVERYWGVDPDDVLERERQLLAHLEQDVAQDVPGDGGGYDPTGRYDRRTVQGWTVYVSPALVGQPGLCDEMVTLLAYKLHMINHFIADAGERELQRVPLWLETGLTGRTIRYCDDREQLKREGANPDKYQAVEIRNPQRMKRWALLQQSDVLHHLALGCYDRHAAKEDDTLRAKVAAAYAQAVREGRYRKVLRFDGQDVAHPALGGERRYFAEMMESYFLVNDHYPFIRCELQEQDAGGYALIAGLWEGNPRR